MQLIRLGALKGINLDCLVSWEVEAPPAPRSAAPASVEGSEGATAPPEDTAADVPVATTVTLKAPEETGEAPAPDLPPARLTLTLASGGAMETLTLEGREAAAMRDYLQSKSGAFIRAR